MSIAYWCLLVAGLLPYLTVFIAKAQRGYDNRDPRGWAERQEGLRKRAYAAHQNHLEAFPFFAAGLFCAILNIARPELVDTLALTFIGARIAYTAFYLANLAALRSLAWFVAVGCVIALFVASPFNL